MSNWKTDKPCTVCYKQTENGNAIHHVYTRKAWPECENESWNHFPCCFSCHTMMHSKPMSFLVKRYPQIKEWLLENNWYEDKTKGSWKHEIN
jgi:hypothetical protein